MEPLERVDEIVKTIHSIDRNLQYPIHSFQQLADSLGGEDAEIQHEGSTFRIGMARRAFPPGFYPIDSAEDFVAKAAEIRSRLEPGWPGDLQAGTELDAPPAHAGLPPVHESAYPAPGTGLRLKGWRPRDAS